MKNVVTNNFSNGSMTCYRVVTKDDSLDAFYASWSDGLDKSHNTRKNYSNHVALFLDYLIEYGDLNGGLTPQILLRGINDFEEYLIHGSDSENEVLQKVSKNLLHVKYSVSSLDPIFAAVNDFIAESESYRDQLLQLTKAGYIEEFPVSDFVIFEKGKKGISKSVSLAIQRNSYLAGCIQGGVKKLKKRIIKKRHKVAQELAITDNYGGDEKSFPFDQIGALLVSAKRKRDALLWSILAATGCRVSEALTILLEDIDFDRRKIYIIPPAQRASKLSVYLTPSQIEMASHKGRQSKNTFMIEPWASQVWSTLEDYLSNEYKNGAVHPFLFQKVSGEHYALSYRAALDEFKTACFSLGLTWNENGKIKTYGMHSLRHAYGYFLKNWCPRGDGKFGLSIEAVQFYMGHAQQQSTQRYAREDHMKLVASMDYMNALVHQGHFKSVSDSKIQLLEKQIEKLKLAITTTQYKALPND